MITCQLLCDEPWLVIAVVRTSLYVMKEAGTSFFVIAIRVLLSTTR